MLLCVCVSNSVPSQRKGVKHTLVVISHNVTTLKLCEKSGTACQPGALLHYLTQLSARGVGLACLQEVRSSVETTMRVGDFHLALSQGERGQLGVAMAIGSEMWPMVSKIECVSSRLMLLLLRWSNVELIVANVHAPHSGRDETERLAFLQLLRESVDSWRCKHPRANLLRLGDWNATIKWSDLDPVFPTCDTSSFVGEAILDLAVQWGLEPVLPEGGVYQRTFFLWHSSLPH